MCQDFEQILLLVFSLFYKNYTFDLLFIRLLIIFFVFIGRLSFKLDNKFKLWQNINKQNQIAKIFSFDQNMILYPMSLGFFLFALRGDLFSAFSFATGLVISFLIAKKLIIIKCSL